MDIEKEIHEINAIIQSVTSILGEHLPEEKYNFIDRGMPHIPQGLPKNKMGIYMFKYNDTYLKIGKVGSKSFARFLSQHYNPNSAQSTLAASLISDDDFKSLGLTSENVGNWIKKNCHRIDILIDDSVSVFAIELIEALLHYKYMPKYEGFKSQR